MKINILYSTNCLVGSLGKMKGQDKGFDSAYYLKKRAKKKKVSKLR